jgi:predicted membrane protein
MNSQEDPFLSWGVAMTRTDPTTTVSRNTTTGIRAVQAAAVLSVLALLWQFVTAGRILSGAHVVELHGGGAIAVHVTTFLLVAATLWHTRGGGARWPAVVSALVFAATFVQAALGEAKNMSAHVPCALVVTAGTIWVTAWAFRGSDRG